MTRSFCWLNAAQFGGALNDNVFRLLVIFFLIGLKGRDAASATNAAVGAVFVLPFLLFTPWAGGLADRYSKRGITLVVKALETTAMALAMITFYLRSEWLAYGVVFLMSTQSALFGPTKYGIVPELVGRERLSRGNSLLVLYTYLAIICGTALAPTLDRWLQGDYVWAAAICLGIAVAGWGAAVQVERTPSQAGTDTEGVTGLRALGRALWHIRHDRTICWAILAAAYFLLLGGFVQLNLIPYGLEMLGISEQHSAYIFLLAALGIGLGAWSVGRLSGRDIVLRWVPWGTWGAGLACLGLMVVHGSLWVVCAVVFLLGLSAGFFIVPLEACIQARSTPHERGKILAAKAFLAWVGVLTASGLLYLFAEIMAVSPATSFGIMGGLTLLIGAGAYRVFPRPGKQPSTTFQDLEVQ